MEGVGGSGLRYAPNSHFSIPHSGRVLSSEQTHTHMVSLHSHQFHSNPFTYTFPSTCTPHTAKALSTLPSPSLPSPCISSSQANRCHIPSDTEPQCGHWLLNQQTPSLSHQHSSVRPHLPRQDPCLYTTPSQLASRDRPRCSDIQPQCPREEGEHCTGVSCCGIRLCAQTLNHSSRRLGSPPMDWLQHSQQWEPSG